MNQGRGTYLITLGNWPLLIMSRIPAILTQVVVVMPTSQLEIRNRVLCVKDENF